MDPADRKFFSSAPLGTRVTDYVPNYEAPRYPGGRPYPQNGVDLERRLPGARFLDPFFGTPLKEDNPLTRRQLLEQRLESAPEWYRELQYRRNPDLMPWTSARKWWNEISNPEDIKENVALIGQAIAPYAVQYDPSRPSFMRPPNEREMRRASYALGLDFVGGIVPEGGVFRAINDSRIFDNITEGLFGNATPSAVRLSEKIRAQQPLTRDELDTFVEEYFSFNVDRYELVSRLEADEEQLVASRIAQDGTPILSPNWRNALNNILSPEQLNALESIRYFFNEAGNRKSTSDVVLEGLEFDSIDDPRGFLAALRQLPEGIPLPIVGGDDIPRRLLSSEGRETWSESIGLRVGDRLFILDGNVARIIEDATRHQEWDNPEKFFYTFDWPLLAAHLKRVTDTISTPRTAVGARGSFDEFSLPYVIRFRSRDLKNAGGHNIQGQIVEIPAFRNTPTSGSASAPDDESTGAFMNRILGRVNRAVEAFRNSPRLREMLNEAEFTNRYLITLLAEPGLIAHEIGHSLSGIGAGFWNMNRSAPVSAVDRILYRLGAAFDQLRSGVARRHFSTYMSGRSAYGERYLINDSTNATDWVTDTYRIEPPSWAKNLDKDADRYASRGITEYSAKYTQAFKMAIRYMNSLTRKARGRQLRAIMDAAKGTRTPSEALETIKRINFNIARYKLNADELSLGRFQEEIADLYAIASQFELGRVLTAQRNLDADSVADVIKQYFGIIPSLESPNLFPAGPARDYIGGRLWAIRTSLRRAGYDIPPALAGK